MELDCIPLVNVPFSTVTDLKLKSFANNSNFGRSWSSFACFLLAKGQRMPSKDLVLRIYVHLKSMQRIFTSFTFRDVLDELVRVGFWRFSNESVECKEPVFPGCWKALGRSEHSRRRIFSIVKRINCSVVQLVVAYCVLVKYSSCLNSKTQDVGFARSTYRSESWNGKV